MLAIFALIYSRIKELLGYKNKTFVTRAIQKVESPSKGRYLL